MDLIFTEYVRSLTPGEEPDPRLFEKVWSTLRGALFAEMRKRSLWTLDPALFGVHGRASWSEDGAFEELASDCYAFIFLERLPALKAQLKVKDNVEGLVFRNIRNFLHDAQKSNDPVGFKTYKILRAAVTRLIERGTLRTAHGGPRLVGDTVLAFSLEAAARPAGAEALEAPARQWCDELSHGIVTARGRGRDEVAGALAERIARLPGEGVETFRFKDLIDIVKSAVRVRWHALGTTGGAETAYEKVGEGAGRRIRIVRPDTELEDRESFEKLCAHVQERIDRSGKPERTRRELARLWGYLRRHAGGSGKRQAPSRRRIARALAISRHKLAGHFAVLGRWVGRYQDAA